jgi:putative membrane protein
MAGMGLGMVIFWGMIIVGVLYLAGYWTRHDIHEKKGKSASEILKERRARGEISKEQYDKLKKDLTKIK